MGEWASGAPFGRAGEAERAVGRKRDRQRDRASGEGAIHAASAWARGGRVRACVRLWRRSSAWEGEGKPNVPLGNGFGGEIHFGKRALEYFSQYASSLSPLCFGCLSLPKLLPQTNRTIPLFYAEKRMNERRKERDERAKVYVISLSPPLPLSLGRPMMMWGATPPLPPPLILPPILSSSCALRCQRPRGQWPGHSVRNSERTGRERLLFFCPPLSFFLPLSPDH